jgi:hypothetical protein
MSEAINRDRRTFLANGVVTVAAAQLVTASLAHAAAEPPTQQRSQSHAFGIADFGADLVDAGVAGPEKLHATDRTHAVTIALCRGIIEL